MILQIIIQLIVNISVCSIMYHIGYKQGKRKVKMSNMDNKKLNNCWECEECVVIGDGAYVGWHKCKEMKTGNVEHYANRINPQCPLNYEISDEKVFEMFNRMVTEFKKEKKTYSGLNKSIMSYYKDDLQIDVSVSKVK